MNMKRKRQIINQIRNVLKVRMDQLAHQLMLENNSKDVNSLIPKMSFDNEND